MLRQRIPSIAAIGLMAFMVSCSSGTSPVAPLPPATEETGDGFITIRAPSSAYADPAYVGVTATLENHTDQLFYARLGDFYGGLDQSSLAAVAGSSGFLEQWESRSWKDLPRHIATEGVIVVALRPHSTYTLWAGPLHPWSAPRVGKLPDRTDDRPGLVVRPPSQSTYRLEVQYFDDAAMSADKAHHDFSNIFV